MYIGEYIWKLSEFKVTVQVLVHPPICRVATMHDLSTESGQLTN